MGCDIHLHIECKIGGVWHHYAALMPDRRYAVFAKMAGVRGDVSEAISAPKGLPADITVLTKLDAAHWGIDGHSHSWLGVDEIKQLSTWYETEAKGPYHHPHCPHFEMWVGSYFFGNSFHGKEWPPEIEDVRFVFWFDN